MSIDKFGPNGEKTDPETVSFLLSLANDMRKVKGDSLLEDIPESEPQNPYSCVIANAFNYGCSVSPSSEWGWPYEKNEDGSNSDKWAGCITFQTLEDRATYLKVVDPKNFNNPNWEFEYGILDAPLTKELNDIAIAFDKGQAFVEYSDNWAVTEEGDVVRVESDEY